LSKIVRYTSFSLWSEFPTLPFVRFCVKPKITIPSRFLAPKAANLQNDGGVRRDDNLISAFFGLSGAAGGDWAQSALCFLISEVNYSSAIRAFCHHARRTLIRTQGEIANEQTQRRPL